MKFDCADKISRITDPLSWTEEKTSVMVNACREMAIYHYQQNEVVRYIYDHAAFNPSVINQESDLELIPMIGVTAMKYHLLTTLPHEKAVLKLTSSGTRGQKTQIWFDQNSLDRVQAMMEGLWMQEGWVSLVPTNYMMFVYDPEEARDLGIAFSDKNQQRFAPVKESFYAIRKNLQNNWEFQKDKCVEKLKDYASQFDPVRLFGIPSFIYELCQELDETIQLPEGSLMITGGGWKAAEEKKVSKENFRRCVSNAFGIPEINIRDGYGMAEHSAPYDECCCHRFHIPAYNRIIIRDSETMKALLPGETGLLELITPFNAMMPTLALLSTDVGYIDVDPCPCGHVSPTFSLVGRGGITKHKGCALTAGEIIKRG